MRVAFVHMHEEHEEEHELYPKHVRDVLFFFWLVSFVPYFLPADVQPTWYHSPPPPTEEMLTVQRVDRFLKGDVLKSGLMELPPKSTTW